MHEGMGGMCDAWCDDLHHVCMTAYLPVLLSCRQLPSKPQSRKRLLLSCLLCTPSRMGWNAQAMLLLCHPPRLSSSQTMYSCHISFAGTKTHQKHWIEKLPAECGAFTINAELQAIIQPTEEGKLVSEVYFTGAIRTECQLPAGSVTSLLGPRSWWTRESAGAEGAWPAYWPADPLVYCPLTSLSKEALGVTAEIAISPGQPAASAETAEGYFFQMLVGDGSDFPGDVGYTFSCSWSGGGSTPDYVPAAAR